MQPEEREQNQIWFTCHQAAHAVLAYLVDLPLKEISCSAGAFIDHKKHLCILNSADKTLDASRDWVKNQALKVLLVAAAGWLDDELRGNNKDRALIQLDQLVFQEYFPKVREFEKQVMSALALTEQLLREHKDQTDAVADLLLDHGSVTLADIQSVLGPRRSVRIPAIQRGKWIV